MMSPRGQSLGTIWPLGRHFGALLLYPLLGLLGRDGLGCSQSLVLFLPQLGMGQSSLFSAYEDYKVLIECQLCGTVKLEC